MLNNFKKALSRDLTNIRGAKTDRKIIVIDSDDWGSIRIPDRAARDTFQGKGYNIMNNPYCKYDTLANTEDLDALFSILRKHKDSKGNHPVFTANTVVANPDFDAIRNSGFTQYSYKPFTETLKEYYPAEDVFTKWQEGIKENIFRPQYHGREHVNVPLWLDTLQRDVKVFREAFDLGFWGVPESLHEKSIKNIQASYNSDSPDDIAFYENTIEDGLNLFEKIFGYRSLTFIANNYVWSPKLHPVLKKAGVLGLQSMRYQKAPDSSKPGGIRIMPVHTGKRTAQGQIYLVRNCLLEPAHMPESFDDVAECMKEVASAFRFKKPAIISSHRINYIGAISKDNRERNLKLLDTLLQKILIKWPDVEFMSSDELTRLLLENKK